MPQHSRHQPARTTKISDQFCLPGLCSTICSKLPLNKHLSHLSARPQVVIILFLASHHIHDHIFNVGAVGETDHHHRPNIFWVESRALLCFCHTMEHGQTHPLTDGWPNCFGACDQRAAYHCCVSAQTLCIHGLVCRFASSRLGGYAARLHT